MNLLEGTFSFHVLFDNSVCDLCVFWTAGQEAGGCPGRPEGQSLPWHVTPSSHQGWPRASPKSPLLKDRLGTGVHWEWHSPVFYLVFNSSLLNFASSQEFSCCSSCTVPTILGTGGQSGCAIPGCSCWVGHALFVFLGWKPLKTAPGRTAPANFILIWDSTFMLQNPPGKAEPRMQQWQSVHAQPQEPDQHLLLCSNA